MSLLRSSDRSTLVATALLFAVLVTAVGVIYSVHLSRERFSELQIMIRQENALEIEWGQLLLEQSALSSHNNVETLAREKLQMKNQKINTAVIVRP